jgi:hypothetical protein
MDALQFACILYALQQKLCLHIDSDIIEYIYDFYLMDYYEKYTLFELIDALYSRHIPICCELNKNALIKMIKDKKVDIPDKCWYDKKNNTEWCQHTYDWGSHVLRKNVICIKKTNADIEITKDDVFKIDNVYYEILAILNGKIFIYQTRETNICENIYLDIGKFIKMIDENNTTIIKNNIRYSVMITKNI